MLKLEYFDEDKFKSQMHFVCLNPFCLDREKRSFSVNSHHFNLEGCRKWIVNDQQLNVGVETPFKLKQLENLQLNLVDKPIESLKALIRLGQSDWRKQLDKEQAKIKKELSLSVEKQFELVNKSIEQLVRKSQFYQRIVSIIKGERQNITVMLNAYLQESEQIVDGFRNHIIFKRVDIKESIASIKQQIEKISESLYLEKNQTISRKMFSNSQQRHFYEFIFQKSENSFNKLQVVASSYSTPVKNYTVLEEKMSLQCFLCTRRIHAQITFANKKNLKKYLAEQMIVHLYCNHYQQTCFNYTRKILKSHIQQVALQDFFATTKHFDQINIVDRESGVGFQESVKDFENTSLYSVQIITSKNRGVAKGKYIVVNNRQAIDSLIAVLAFQCRKRQQQVRIISNKLALSNALKDLFNGDGNYIEGLKQQSKKQTISQADRKL